jgi:aminoglycoside 6'-N-acetyltransferase
MKGLHVLRGNRVTLRPAGIDDAEALLAILTHPAVRPAWGFVDPEEYLADEIASDEVGVYVIEIEGAAVGVIQFSEEDDPDYRSAGIDIALHPDVHGQGLCTDAVGVLARYLIGVRGHHRLTIDPAADNAAAIRCYEKVGFRAVGVMRSYERGPDGTFHDGLLMDLLAQELPPVPPAPRVPGS